MGVVSARHLLLIVIAVIVGVLVPGTAQAQATAVTTAPVSQTGHDDGLALVAGHLHVVRFRSPHAAKGGGFLSADDFASLPRTGRVDPSGVRFSQDSISPSFSEAKFGTIDDLTAGLREFAESGGARGINPAGVKPIRIVERDGGVFTLDNRRLKAFQDAGGEVPFQRLDAVPRRQEFKFTTQNQGTSIRIRGR